MDFTIYVKLFEIKIINPIFLWFQFYKIFD